METLLLAMTFALSAMATLRSKTGKEYKLTKNKKSGWTATRTDTGSKVKISQAMVDGTRERLERGEEIPFREISYTVAIETAVVHLLEDVIEVDSENRVYRLKER